ncbi:hypothetical protein D9757_010417 [Collybiopsis confluens]|uniref:PNPLA domain-containing protein n=1 Tax=Collybiopsis confluens TaxID=2823264 RepID=A0A8H5GPZ7_9AGAR|nr:hypothetical protein D9757_010417 [Collybiopsis confluens]
MSFTSDLESAWLCSSAPCEPITAVDGRIKSSIWFKSKPVSREFCYRVTQLQLCTDSRNQGWVDNRDQGNWTWFEIIILPDEDATEPKRSKHGREMVWRSHHNQLGKRTARHYGAIFDRRSELLANFEVGDVLAVRVCARFPGSTNYATKGYISARVLSEGKSRPVPFQFSEDLEDGSYSFVSTIPCAVRSSDADLKSKIWFTTPAFDERSIEQLESLQLFTRSHLQSGQEQAVEDGNSFSWFDLVVLEDCNATEPKVLNGVSLVWLSHSNKEKDTDPHDLSQGISFDITDSRSQGILQIKASLKASYFQPGNAIGVRACAQFAGWENHANFGQLVVRISNMGYTPQKVKIPDVTVASQDLRKIQQTIYRFYQDIKPTDQPAFSSPLTDILTNEARADLVLEQVPPGTPLHSDAKSAGTRPLRLLSLDGGGVRGVSSLRILQKLMEEVAEEEHKPDIKPHEYFDLMVGTSTGGLIALMLGRLHMSIEECETEYDIISEKVFGKKGLIINDEDKAFLTGSSLYEAKYLEDEFKRLVQRKLGDADAPLFESDDPGCKVFVMSALASTVEDGNTAVHLRSYKSGPTVLVPAEYSGWSIWEAARATSAAPVYFKSFEKNGKEFVDGGLGWNNPVLELISELPTICGQNFSIGCLVSIGTGTPAAMHLGTGLLSINDFITIATNSELAHQQSLGLSQMLPLRNDLKYWRFNMSKKMSEQDWVVDVVSEWFGLEKKEKRLEYADIMGKIDDWGAIGMIRELTDKWLMRFNEQGKTKEFYGIGMQSCAKRLSGKNM